MAAWWTHTGFEKTSGAGYYFHVSAKEVIIAAGSYMPEKEQLAAIRHWLLDHHAEFRKLLKRPTVRKLYDEFEGNALTRPPKGFPCEHPGMDLDPLPPMGTGRRAAREGRAQKGHCRRGDPLLQGGRAGGGRAQHADRRSLAPKRKVLFGLR